MDTNRILSLLAIFSLLLYSTPTIIAPASQSGEVSISIPIRADNLDGFEDPTFHISGDGLHDDWVGTQVNVITGWIFTNVQIPKGATILSSYVRFRGFGTGGSSTARIYGFAQDNVPAFAQDGSNKPSMRPATSAFVDWPNSWSYEWQWFQTPDLSAIIQETVNRPGWATGNSIGFNIRNPFGTGTNWCVVDYAGGPYGGGGPGHSVTLYITYVLGTPSIVSEARLDIGMPYPDCSKGAQPRPCWRGCPSDDLGCGGLYHGFYKGVCTDLVMDAYNVGVPFNIQNALSQDHRANPGRYRWGSARNAEDMRRYFRYNQTFLSHSQPYQAGDLAFFDWDSDGLTDHVLVISEVDANNRPLKMVDASDVIPGINPSGLAFEHSWSNYYEQRVQGHARLSSNNLASTAVSTEPVQILRVSVSPMSVGLSLFGSNGKSVSEVYEDGLVASNNEAFIPYIPGGSYANSGAQKVITVTQPLSNTNQYSVRIEGQANITYTLFVESLQDTSVTASQTFTQAIGAGGVHNLGITLSAPGGVISFTAQSPMPSPVTNLPSSLSLGGLVGTSAQLTFTISEIGGQQAISNTSITATDLSTQYGIQILSSQLTITPTNFSVAAGSNQQVSVQVNLANLNPGEYLGSLILTSQSGNPVMIPLTLRVQYHTLYLPFVIRN